MKMELDPPFWMEIFVMAPVLGSTSETWKTAAPK